MGLTTSFHAHDDVPTVTGITRLRPGGDAEIFLLRIRPPAGFSYKAGQYVDIGFGKLAPRSYSIANAPGEDTIEIHIKRTRGEVGLFVASVLRAGDTVTLSAAKGGSAFDPADKRPLLLIAGGVGFTPLKAIAEAALRRDPDAPVHFFWGTERADEKYMRDYFRDMADQYDGFDFHDINGTPVGAATAATFDSLADFRIYMAGPPAMIDTTLPLLLARGARADAIFYDRAPSPPLPGKPGHNHE